MDAAFGIALLALTPPLSAFILWLMTRYERPSLQAGERVIRRGHALLVLRKGGAGAIGQLLLTERRLYWVPARFLNLLGRPQQSIDLSVIESCQVGERDWFAPVVSRPLLVKAHGRDFRFHLLALPLTSGKVRNWVRSVSECHPSP